MRHSFTISGQSWPLAWRTSSPRRGGGAPHACFLCSLSIWESEGHHLVFLWAGAQRSQNVGSVSVSHLLNFGQGLWSISR